MNKTLTLRRGETLTLNGIAWTIVKLDVRAGKVQGVSLNKPAGPDAGGDTMPGAIEGVYLTAAMLRQRLS